MAARWISVAPGRPVASVGPMALEPRALLAGAALCAGAFMLLLALAYGSSGARSADASALQGFLGLQRPRVTPITEAIGSIGNAFPVAVLAAILAAVAFARGRPRVSLLVLLFVGLTSVSSQVLKALLAYPRDPVSGFGHIDPAAFPSGHATASMTIAIALVIVMPGRLRPLAAVVGVALALGVSFSVVSMGWHFPSDVIGGYLLAAGWALVLLAAVRATDLRFPERAGRSALAQHSRATVDAVVGVGLVATLMACLAAAAAALAVVVVFRLPDALDYVQDHPAFSLAFSLLSLSAVGLLSALTLVLARRG